MVYHILAQWVLYHEVLFLLLLLVLAWRTRPAHDEPLKKAGNAYVFAMTKRLGHCLPRRDSCAVLVLPACDLIILKRILTKMEVRRLSYGVLT